MSENTSREVRLKTRPVGLPKESDFELAEVTVGAPGEDEVLIRNLYMSVDPYMRGRMIDRKSYATPFEVGAVMHGGAVGEVVESRADGFQVGDHVLSKRLERALPVVGRHASQSGRQPGAPVRLPGRARYAGPNRLHRAGGHW